MIGPTLGTHNTHDEAGRVTLFADAVGFTEAVPVRVRARVAIAARGYAVRVCSHQPSLVFAARRRVWKILRTYYVPAHDGRKGVTPHRGTFVIETRRRATGKPEAFLVCHRINAAFPPYKRGEGAYRAGLWYQHDEIDEDLARDYRQRGWVVHAMGDVNTPHGGVCGFPVLPCEVGEGLDRIASTIDLTYVEHLGAVGSDHPRLRARLAR